ncbi:MAG: response regulator [Pseudomonas sp.]
MVDVLQELGYSAIEAEDGASALAILQDSNQSLSLMMTDVGLPDLSGKDLALKARELRPLLPILFASGYTENVEAPEGMHSIGKPFTIDQLRLKVQGILDPTA